MVSPQIPKTAPSEWSIEEVIQYIAATDPALAIHADLFRKHVSNGGVYLWARSSPVLRSHEYNVIVSNERMFLLI